MNAEELKKIYGDNITDELVENFSSIDAIDFTYKPEAQEKGEDNKEHIGVIAQELEKNPVTASTVNTGDDGLKRVDTASLTMVDTAVLSEMSKRILALEEVVSQLLEDKENE